MKKKLFTLLLTLTTSYSNFFAQNTNGKTDDAGRIALNAYVPSQVGDLTPTAQDALKLRLQRIVTSNGIAGSPGNRFVLTAKIVELTKDVLPTTPISYAYTLEVTLMIGDAVSGNLFSSLSFETKGAGKSVTKAYMSAIKKIKSKSSKYTEFLDDAKTKILEHYNANCDFYLKDAETLKNSDQFEEAIAVLASIPDVCKDCYMKAMDNIVKIYKFKINKECKVSLTNANNAWNASQDGDAANNAAIILANIDPNSDCYDDARLLANKIAKRIKELDQREWDFKLKQQQDQVNKEAAEIKAARDIGVAEAKNQPKAVYNTTLVYGWW